MGSVRQVDTETQFLDVFEDLVASFRQPGNKMDHLKYVHDYFVTAECITIDSSHERVIINHADGTEVQISLKKLAIIDAALSQFDNRTSHGDASIRQYVSNENDLPKQAEMLLHFGLPKRDREYMIGDLEEEFHSIILPKYGPRVAARWYWWQAVRSVAAASGGRFRVWMSAGGLYKAAGWIVEKFGL